MFVNGSSPSMPGTHRYTAAGNRMRGLHTYQDSFVSLPRAEALAALTSQLRMQLGPPSACSDLLRSDLMIRCLVVCTVCQRWEHNTATTSPENSWRHTSNTPISTYLGPLQRTFHLLKLCPAPSWLPEQATLYRYIRRSLVMRETTPFCLVF